MWENKHQRAYTLRNKYANFFCSRTVLVEFIVEDVITFLKHNNKIPTVISVRLH